MQAHSVVDLVRACDSTYSRTRVEAAGVRVHDMVFPDGDPPPDAIITRWLTLCRAAFKGGKSAVAVHCVAGLGRAPVLVAIALIEDGVEPLDAVQLIRAKRRGAINAKQVRTGRGWGGGGQRGDSYSLPVSGAAACWPR